MKHRRLLLALGLTAMALGTAFVLSKEKPKLSIMFASSVVASDCFAPELCADREVICPAGPDCFYPERCANHDLVCPPSCDCDNGD